MTVSPLTTEQHITTQRSSRNGAKIDHFIVHHSVSTSLSQVIALMMGAKEVSANYIIGNEGQIVAVVPEEYRAWTSSSAEWDGRSITVEIINQSLYPGYGSEDPSAYPISPAAQRALEALISDVGSRYGFNPTRGGKNSTVLGHRDLSNWFDASYATQCPGGYTYTRLPQIAAAASNGSIGPIGEDDMYDANAQAALFGKIEAESRPLKLYQYGTGFIVVGPGGKDWPIPSGAYHELLKALALTSAFPIRVINKDELGFIKQTLGLLSPDPELEKTVNNVISLSKEDADKLSASLGETALALSEKHVETIAKLIADSGKLTVDQVKVALSSLTLKAA